jgi:hypothetical protein
VPLIDTLEPRLDAAYVRIMEQPERNEVYERIPWETLEEKKPDRQWLTLGVAGAIVLGALAYSFTSNRPAAVTPTTTAASAVPSVSAPVTNQVIAPPVAAPPPSTAPVVTAEADLYAVHPERIIDRVMAHAEWFVAEYLTVDGSDQAQATLGALLPAGIPPPTAPDGTRVFVEWVRATEVEETGPLLFEVTVLARSLSATGEEAYVRQAPIEVVVPVSVAGEIPQVTTAPRMNPAPIGPAHELALVPVPEEVSSAALEKSGGTEVVGGVQGAEGVWEVVVLAPSADGVSRAVSVTVP